MIRQQVRFVRRNGELTQQNRSVTSTTKNKCWWKPWVYEVEYSYGKWIDIPIPELDTLRAGDRVKVLMTAGFHKGATGVIEYVAPDGRIWVLRDGATTAVYYDEDELELIWRRPSCLT